MTATPTAGDVDADVVSRGSVEGGAAIKHLALASVSSCTCKNHPAEELSAVYRVPELQHRQSRHEVCGRRPAAGSSSAHVTGQLCLTFPCSWIVGTMLHSCWSVLHCAHRFHGWFQKLSEFPFIVKIWARDNLTGGSNYESTFSYCWKENKSQFSFVIFKITGWADQSWSLFGTE